MSETIRKEENETSIDKILNSPRVRDEAIKLAVKEGTYAIEKYRKKSAIVEEGEIILCVALDVVDDGAPITEIRADDTHLGYINDGKSDTRNEATFRVPCYKKGDGKWGKIKVIAKPIRSFSKNYKEGSYSARFAPSKEDQPTTVYITMKKKLFAKKTKAIVKN